MTLVEPRVDVDASTQKMLLDQIAEYVFQSKYARYIEHLKRRETWPETVARVEKMHLDHYDYLLSEEDRAEIHRAFDLVRAKTVVPSMRSMQFGGQAIEAKNERMYNCAVRHIDSLRSFAESFYLLLCGCGVGFGLTDRFLDRLPALVGPEDKSGTVLTYVVEDTIEGWADSLEALLMCYFKNTPFTGRKFVPDFSKIRKAGSKLKTSGGKAPGHVGLKSALLKIKALLDRIIEDEGVIRLRTIDAYDILMHASDAVLSGGVRRSACSVIFDKDDELMMNAKSGDWSTVNPQRARSNNSVMLLRSEMTEEEVVAVIQRAKEWGEPGFVFADDPNTLYNPCFEISFIPMTDDGVCGVQFCNLTSITAPHLHNEADFQEAVWAATVIGTLQAGYTNFPYLGHVAEELTRSESLLGVSMTGVYDNPKIALDPDIQRRGAAYSIAVNEEWAMKLGIPPASRNTTMKPEGSGSIVRWTMASGMKPTHYKPRMWRRVQCNVLDAPYQLFKQYNPHLCEPSVWSANKTDDVITFPIYVSDDVITQSDLTAIRHLKDVRSVQENWVMPGTSRHNAKPVHHNVSCTVVVADHEWGDVASYLFKHRESFAAVSLLAATGDKDYAQAPNEAVVTPAEVALWEEQVRNMIPVDYTLMIEDEDGTTLAQELSCAGGACEVI